MKHIGIAIQKFLKENKTLNDVVNSYKINKLLDELLGDFFLKNGVSIKKIKNKKLFIICPEQLIKTEIFNRRAEIINKINTSLANDTIDEIILVNA